MKQYTDENLLIIAKTYPNPSKSYRETVCVVAVNENRELRRLYPIEFRYLDLDQQFTKWQWIHAKTAKSSDWRPESHVINNDSITTGKKLSTRNGWAERINWIQNFIYPDFYSLEKSQEINRTSIGIIEPKDFHLDITTAKDKEWTPEQLASLRKDGLFDNNTVRTKPIVKKIPFEFRYSFITGNDQIRHHFLVTDWEVGALFWNCQKKYGNEWEVYFRKKLEDDLKDRNTYFIMGTIHGHPNQWLIIGLVYPPRTYQQSLLNNPI